MCKIRLSYNLGFPCNKECRKSKIQFATSPCACRMSVGVKRNKSALLFILYGLLALLDSIVGIPSQISPTPALPGCVHLEGVESSEADGHVTLSNREVFLVMGRTILVSRVRHFAVPKFSLSCSQRWCDQEAGRGRWEDDANLSSGISTLYPLPPYAQ